MNKTDLGLVLAIIFLALLTPIRASAEDPTESIVEYAKCLGQSFDRGISRKESLATCDNLREGITSKVNSDDQKTMAVELIKIENDVWAKVKSRERR